MDREHVDVVVIGLGAIGSGALRHLAMAGAQVVGIGSSEPAEFATHDGVFASHYDSGRITRHIDPTFEWAELARRAIAEYPRIAADGAVAFHHPCGVVYGARGAEEVRAVDGVCRRLDALGIAVKRSATCNDDRLAFPAGLTFFTEGPPAGHVNPRAMMAAQLTASRRHGATVIDGRAVSVATTSQGRWRVRLADSSELETTTVVLAGGPHSDELGGLPPMPLLTVRTESVVMAVLDSAEAERLHGLPSALAPTDDPLFVDIYMVPPTTYPDGTVRLKLGATRHRPPVVGTGVARRAWMRSDAHLADLPVLRALTEALVPGLRAQRWETKPCLITDTPNGLPYVDHLTEGLVLATGCNGYAAKSGDAIGALAANLVVNGAWNDPVLAAKRFVADVTVVSMRAGHARHVH